VIKLHPLGGEPVNVWGVVDARPVATNGFGCMVIGHNEDDVWSPDMVLLGTPCLSHVCSLMVGYRA
jgi:hypothetical protein